MFLKDFLKSHPSIEFSLEHDFSRKITEGIISLRLDLGIVVNPVRHPDLVIKKICEDHVGFWKSDKLHPSLEKVLIADENLMQTQNLLQRSKKGETRFTRFIRTSSLELVRELTLQGCGVGVLPGRVAMMNGGKGLEVISDLPTHKDEICLVYRSERREHRTLREVVTKVSASIK